MCPSLPLFLISDLLMMLYLFIMWYQYVFQRANYMRPDWLNCSWWILCRSSWTMLEEDTGPSVGSARDWRHRTPSGGLSAWGKVQFRLRLLPLNACEGEIALPFNSESERMQLQWTGICSLYIINEGFAVLYYVHLVVVRQFKLVNQRNINT